MSQQVSSSLGTIQNDTHKVSELLEEIATASQEQEVGISQINQAVSQMEIVIQSTASTAQESATSASNLDSYAVQISGIVDALKALLDDAKSGRIVPSISSGATKVQRKTTTKIAPKTSISERRVSHSVKPPVSDLTGAKVVNPEDVIPLDDF